MVATMPTVQLLWVNPPRDLRGWEIEVPESVIDEGVIEAAGDDFEGPAGAYRLLPTEHCFALNHENPMPLFLHESYDAHLEKWANTLPDAAEEVVIVGKVRNAVIQLASSRTDADPDAFSATPTVTTTEPSPQGMIVVGRAVVFQPAQ